MEKQSFIPSSTDFNLSPYTGLTRASWLSAAKHLLLGIFKHINDFSSPIVMPRSETKITYPHINAAPHILEAEKRAEIFEGLTRSLFIASVLIKNEPEVSLNGIKLADYYKSHILRVCTKGDNLYVGNYEDLQEMTHHADPFRPFQQTVETCALVIGLWVSKNQIWDSYTKSQKDTIAAFLASYAHANTVPQNWRLFNMLDMAFLDMNGYAIDKEIMLEHAAEISAYYAGSGWYRDGQSFDYYSVWAFQVYAPLWNKWYGYKNAPFLARKFEEYSNELMKTYADFFDADGFTNMWGRSNIYRFASTSAFDANFYLENPTVNPGLARRICSGSLLQFLGREDFYSDGIPSLGFYGQFSPLVQGYSCAESPFWLGKAFLCLDLPEEHPFWTAKEENGTWEKLQESEVKITTLDEPALCFSNHKSNGTTILRTGKIVKNRGDNHSLWNYAKLAYSTKYPWEATPPCTAEQLAIEAQQYVLTDNTTNQIEKCNATFWCGQKDGVLYRRQFFEYDLKDETHWKHAINLADFAVPYGIIRADRIRLYKRPVTLTLGTWGFPNNQAKIIKKELDGAKAIILKGFDSQNREKQLAFTIFAGWKELDIRKSTGTNPDSKNSIVAYAISRLEKQYGGAEPHILISQTLTKESFEDFADDELFPIEQILYSDTFASGIYGSLTLKLKNGSSKEINFDGIEGKLSL